MLKSTKTLFLNSESRVWADVFLIIKLPSLREAVEKNPKTIKQTNKHMKPKVSTFLRLQVHELLWHYISVK